jgi:IclR family acetate operon transcriptional repressor
MQQGTKSLAEALKLLKFFADKQDGWRVTQLAATAGVHKSRVSRVLRTFEAYGFVQRKDTTYQLGPAFKTYASLVNSDRALVDFARPIMEKLSRQTRGTALLKVRDGGETVTIERVESTHFLRLAYPLGLRLPLNASSSGKIFLAYMSPAERRQIYRTGFFRKFTAKTITNIMVLEKDLTAARRKGFALSDEEHLQGALGVAAPIFGPLGHIEATLGVGIPKVLLPDRKIANLGATVQRAAAEISLILGYRPGNNGYNERKHRKVAMR